MIKEHAKPEDRFIVGDSWRLLKPNWKPNPHIHYCWTGYMGCFHLAGRWPLPLGLPSQVKALQRLYEKVDGRIPMVWMYGKAKPLCWGDEYKDIWEWCHNRPDIEYTVLYQGAEKWDILGNKYLPVGKALEFQMDYIMKQNPPGMWHRRWWKWIGARSRSSLEYGN
jgi:hypothetical protein